MTPDIQFTDARSDLEKKVTFIPPTQKPGIIFKPFGCLVALGFLGLFACIPLSEALPDDLAEMVVEAFHQYWAVAMIIVLFSMWLFGFSTLLSDRREMLKKSNAFQATCMGYDVFKARSQDGYTWRLTVLCRYGAEDKAIDITPSTGSSSFFTRNSAINYLNSRIAPDGSCLIYVKPNDPTDGWLAPYDYRAMGFMILFLFLVAGMGLIFFNPFG